MVCGENMPGSKKLIDIIDEMNMKEADFTHKVIRKLDRLARLIFDVKGDNADLIFVNSLMEEAIESDGNRVTKPELEKCNRLYKQYKELSK